MTAGSRLVLNPDSAHGKMFLPAEIAALLTGDEVGVPTRTQNPLATVVPPIYTRPHTSS